MSEIYGKEYFMPGPRVHPTMANPEPIDVSAAEHLANLPYPHAYQDVRRAFLSLGRCQNPGCGELLEHCTCKEDVDAFFEAISSERDYERRVTDPDTGGQKGTKRQRMGLLPWDSLMKVSEHYAAGAEKYEDRNWERGYAWHLTFDALQRHLAAWWMGEDLDDEGLEHLNAVVFHALALRTFTLRGIGTDDRPTNG